jgi:acyl dehydratase
MKTFQHLADMEGFVGKELGSSEWLLIDQPRVNLFADATDDHQWIHLDAERAKSGPFGATIAHGFLTLSLLPAMLETSYAFADVRMTINYGLGRVRFPAPVKVGGRVRGHMTLKRYEQIDGGAQLTIEASIECEGTPKPVCVAESLLRYYV